MTTPKEIAHEDHYYDTKILIFSFTWACLAAHSMAKDNFNKSKETTPTTSAASKVAP